ncbi:hypothetical protein EPUS_07505 [Endocarpon pusillum Z07020]|uniref:Amino acid transporter transmembrane domain-containing protein n=1 Tax=Endocarpon pusillum (strain Z07020 / HMAS-L-300199) TaxID=1263415 RepID=U1GNR0_ENDPU|nr:uncharacterized protein EPUS_07505 [Endocarpon pusillum Z07020]ERF73571.1 hypothetical protein EPUS_07505 [Endocarpon pusillum Z07020]
MKSYRYSDQEKIESPPERYENGTQAPLFYDDNDVFGHEASHQIRYKTLTWHMVAVLMIAEIVSNGMLSLPGALAVVGIVPGLILIIFLGVFATFTSWILIQFKLRHPQVHNMGDAGMILFGAVGREVLAGGTVVFAVCATGSQMLAGQISLAALSDAKLCLMLYTGIFALPVLLLSFPRTFDQLAWCSVPACLSLLIAGRPSGAGERSGGFLSRVRVHHESRVCLRGTLYVLRVDLRDEAAAGCDEGGLFAADLRHYFLRYVFYRQSSAAWKCVQVIFAAVVYAYIGSTVASPAFSSLPPRWMKAAYGVAIPNFLIAGSLYSHTAAKILHLHEHTVLGWGTWTVLIILMNGAAFVLAVGVPIFPYLVGIAASLFASWFTYGIAGMFWLHDSYHESDNDNGRSHLHGGSPLYGGTGGGGFKAWLLL